MIPQSHNRPRRVSLLTPPRYPLLPREVFDYAPGVLQDCQRSADHNPAGLIYISMLYTIKPKELHNALAGSLRRSNLHLGSTRYKPRDTPQDNADTFTT